MQPTSPADLALLRASLSDDTLVFLDGFHATKHAARFGADIQLVACVSEDKLAELAADLAPDLADALAATARVISRSDINAIGTTRSHWTGVWGVARRPHYTVEQVLSTPGPVVLLENPQNMGNLGATIRVAAAASAAGLLITGNAAPWSAAVIRGAAGLQFALPIASLTSLDQITPPASTANHPRPLIAIDPEGTDISEARFPANPILAFGTERHGLSPELLALAAHQLQIPMRPGVSSLNLATAVAVTLYSPAVLNAH
jgi:TrmH family RNA methyltransferase